jgi:hypothetical protein
MITYLSFFVKSHKMKNTKSCRIALFLNLLDYKKKQKIDCTFLKSEFFEQPKKNNTTAHIHIFCKINTIVYTEIM